MSKIEHPQPTGLLKNPAFSQVVAASGAHAIYTGGQVSIDEHGALVGADDPAEQTAQTMRNVGLALAAAGASYENIVKITTYVVGYKPEHRAVIGKRGLHSSLKEGRLRARLSVSPRSLC